MLFSLSYISSQCRHPGGNRNFPHTTQLVSSKLEPIRTKEKEAPSERRTRERPSRRSARERKAAEKAVSNFADDLSLLRLREGERERGVAEIGFLEASRDGC